MKKYTCLFHKVILKTYHLTQSANSENLSMASNKPIDNGLRNSPLSSFNLDSNKVMWIHLFSPSFTKVLSHLYWFMLMTSYLSAKMLLLSNSSKPNFITCSASKIWAHSPTT